MKKNLWMMIFTVAAAILLAGCEAKEVKLVKNGVLAIDKSRTVEQALSAKLDDLNWEKFVNEQKKTIVKATGIWTNKNTISYYRPTSVGGPAFEYVIVRPGTNVEVCFVINLDGTFAFHSGKFSGGGKLGYDDYGAESVKDTDLYRLSGGFLGVLYD